MRRGLRRAILCGGILGVAPVAPSLLGAVAASDTAIDLTWTDNATDETGFKIERSADGSTGWTEIGVNGANDGTYSDTGLTAETTYYYRVRAYNGSGNSTYSNTASATTEAASGAPEGVTELDTSIGDGVAGTTLVLTVPMGGVAQDRTLLILFGMYDAVGTISAADDRGNTYVVDREQVNTSDCRGAILRARVTTALQEGDEITITHPESTPRAAAAIHVAGIATAPLDQVASASGNSASPSSGSVTTSTGDQLLFGGIVTSEGNPSGAHGFAPGSGWTEITNAEDNMTSGVLTVCPEYRIEANTGTFAANGALTRGGVSGAREYAALVASYEGGA